MSLAGARGLILLSRSPCDWLAAMVADRVDERAFYAQVTGERYIGDYGLQRSATQRGTRFERRLYANEGIGLRRVLSPLCGISPEEMGVRSFVTSQKEDRLPARKANLASTRGILLDLAEGKTVPHLIIQPQLVLPIGPSDFRYIEPDFMLLLGIGSRREYVCGEIKSNILQQGMAAPADRGRARLQAGVEVLALQAELARIGITDGASNRAIFLYSSPNDLSPAPPVVEHLEAEVWEIRRAVTRLNAILIRLRELRQGNEIPLQDMLAQLTPHYIETCPTICLLADICKRSVAGHGQALGDNAASLLGSDADLSRIASLLFMEIGVQPASDSELAIIAQLRDLLSCINPGSENIGQGQSE